MRGQIPFEEFRAVESESWDWSWLAEGTGEQDPSILEGKSW